jgi:hypothetical protein
MKLAGPKYRFCIWTLYLGIIALQACDSGQFVTIDNETRNRVVVFEDEENVGTVGPGERAKFAVLKFDGEREYRVSSESGETLSTRKFTWSQLLKEKGILIKIE